jgi:paraquat-inducible protein B
MNQTLSHDSLIQHDFRSVLQELAKAATAIESLADSLQRQPNAVIFGKE